MVNFSAISFAAMASGAVPYESPSPPFFYYELKISTPAPTTPTAAAIALKPLEPLFFSTFSISTSF